MTDLNEMIEQPPILIVDDDDNNLHVLEMLLDTIDCIVVKAHGGEEALHACKKQEFSCILLDVQMPQMDGFTFAKTLNDVDYCYQGPIVFMSAAFQGEFSIKKGYQCGAIDYLLKPFEPEILLAKVNTLIALYIQKIKAESSFLKQQELSKELDKLAHYDPLTQLLNRRKFWEVGEKTLSICSRNKDMFALLLIDIDGFKNINDTQGHDVGDALLMEISKRLTVSVRRSDTIARMGGDEFAIIVPNVKKEEDLSLLGEKLLLCLSEPFKIMGSIINVSGSIGISCFPYAGSDIGDLFKKADIALYRAKDGGKNNFKFYSQSLNQKYQLKMKIENALKSAIDQDDFVFHYQPCIDLKTGNIVGAEALLRWKHKEFGWVEPDLFIPIAESTGLIKTLGAWVIETACKDYGLWIEKHNLKTFSLAINLSSHQLMDETFTATFMSIIEKNNIDLTNITIELSESAFDRSFDRINTTLKYLLQMKCNVAVDDFGIGFSSLSRLTQLPINTLKIDNSLITKIGRSIPDEQMINLTITLARTLGYDIIAEGVETQEQKDFLLNIMGGDHSNIMLAQGFFYSPPITKIEFEKIFKNGNIGK